MSVYRLSSILAILVLFCSLSTCITLAAPGPSDCTPMAVNRVTQVVDEGSLTPLAGNVHPMARAEFDQGKVDDSLPLEHIVMVLNRTPEQELALQTRIDQMHNSNSPLFQQWLSSAQVGSCYGVADADIAAVTAWLQKHGFRIDSVAESKIMVIFSGNAGQVAEAFHTEIHNLQVHNEKHIANMSAPQVPAALAPVIAGIHSLHDFLPKPTLHRVGVQTTDPNTGKLAVKANPNAASLLKPVKGNNPNPLVTYTNNPFCAPVDCEWLGPQDFYTIYNEKPLLNGRLCGGRACDGTGQTIAVIEETDVCAGQSGTSPDDCAGANDLASFRSQFGLPPAKVRYYFGVPYYCADPGVQGPNGTGEESEADIDLQWAGSTAPGATVDYIACASTTTMGGVDLAAMYAVNKLQNTVSSFSVSYGVCEEQLPLNEFPFIFGNNAFYNRLWQQAVAQGQTVNISAGDSGDDACDRGATAGTSGWNVNGLASTPYNVAAGGTDFTDNYTSNFALAPTQYWSTNDSPPYESALSYIPEVTWNQSCASTLIASFLNFDFGTNYTPEQVCNGDTPVGTDFTYVNGAGSGGISSLYRIPTWQSVFGVGQGNTSRTMRNLPDISLFASANFWGHALQFCESDIVTGTGNGTPCNYSNANEGGLMAAGGTSFVGPQFNGVIALINQATYSRQGQPNYRLYALASHEYGVPGLPNILPFVPSVVTCESNYLTIANFADIFAACVFYDVYRTPAITTNTCVAFDSANCVVDGNEMPCVTGSVDCFTATSGDAYGLYSISTSRFEPAWYQSAGYSDATGLGSFNITNLVKNWNNNLWFAAFDSTTAASANPNTISAEAEANATTLTATVTATGRGGVAPPMGTVSFYTPKAGYAASSFSCEKDQQARMDLLGAAALAPGEGNASAVLRVTAARFGGSGTHTVVACFSGDAANDAPSLDITSVTVSK
jgi:subtilase family serine protease